MLCPAAGVVDLIGNRKIAALCVSRINDEVCFETITSLGAAFAKMNCSLFVYATPSDLYWDTPGEKGESSVFNLADMDVIDVLIIFSDKVKSISVLDELECRARERGVPVISIGSTNGRCYDVEFDYETGFEMVVRHVLDEHKPRTVHFMAGIKDNDFSDKRLGVFKKILEEKNIPFDDSMVSYGDFWSMPAARATEKLIEENRLPEAIICANDAMAISVCNVLRGHHYRVPDDIIVTGFDGITEIEFSIPKITSCKCHCSDIAEKCAEISAMLWEGKEPPRSSRILPQMILSESCGCNYTEKVNSSEYLSLINNQFYRFREEERSLADMTAKMQICRTVEEAAREIKNPILYDLSCVLSLECIDDSVNPLKPPEKNPFGEKMCLFFNSDAPNDPPREMSVKEIIPDLQKQLELGYPLIFVALNFLDIPLGYLCFHFHDCYFANYLKIPQTLNALNNAIGGFRNIRYQQYLGRQLEEMYKIDSLTGLYNRRGFSQEYKKLLSKHGNDERLTVVLSDLDGLKQINDRYGHGEGDCAIRTAADALRHACPDSAICVRFGGDEMLAVISGAVDESRIRQAAESFLDDFNSSSGKPYKVSASFGIYVTDGGDSPDFEEIVKRSDILMYADKEHKKRSVI